MPNILELVSPAALTFAAREVPEPVENSLATGTWHSVLDGGDGADTLRVSGGRDNVLRGGAGLDQMWAGGGTDRFVFLAASDSTQSTFSVAAILVCTCVTMPGTGRQIT